MEVHHKTQELPFTEKPSDMHMQEESRSVDLNEESSSLRRKESKTYVLPASREDLKFEHYKRKEIVFKTILRLMRKQVLDEFNDLTQFILKKRYRETSFFDKCLSSYIGSKLDGMVHDMEEMKLLIAGLTYHKDAKTLPMSKAKREMARYVHTCLY